MLPSRFAELTSPYDDMSPWFNLARTSYWKRLLDAAKRAVVEQPPVVAQCTAEHDSSAKFFCYECSREFSSMQLLNNHARLYAPNLQCLSCRERLVQHLTSTKTNDCLVLLQNVYHPLPSENVKQMDSAALRLRKQKSVPSPAYRCMGPRLYTDKARDGLRRL